MNVDLVANIEDVLRASSAGDILDLVNNFIDPNGFVTVLQPMQIVPLLDQGRRGCPKRSV